MKKHRFAVDRRVFLVRAGQGLGALGLGGILDPIEALAASEPPRVVVVQGTDPVKMLQAALKVFKGLEGFVKGKKVVLKPNMSFKNPAAWGNNTSPEVAAAVARACKDAGAAGIIAVDHAMGQGGQSLVSCGVAPALEKVGGIQVVSAHQRSDYTKLRIPAGKQLKAIEVPKVVTEGQVIINIPVAKQHNATKVSFGLKNLMGLVWDRAHFHEMINLHQGIADLATVLRPALTIIDATRVMTTSGPQGPGKVEKLDTIIVSTDPVAADAVAVGLTQWASQNLTPKEIEHIQAASLLGLGVADLTKIKIIKKRA
jgi:uncharacterized protein (DUF362 family)